MGWVDDEEAEFENSKSKSLPGISTTTPTGKLGDRDDEDDEDD
jgi:hypothetical protein